MRLSYLRIKELLTYLLLITTIIIKTLKCSCSYFCNAIANQSHIANSSLKLIDVQTLWNRTHQKMFWLRMWHEHRGYSRVSVEDRLKTACQSHISFETRQRSEASPTRCHKLKPIDPIRGETTFSNLGVQFLGLGYYYLSTEKLESSTQFGAVGYIITLYSSKNYVKR